MLVRTILLATAGLLLVLAISSALVPRETRTATGASAVAAAARNPDPPRRPGAVAAKDASIPPDKTITALVGQPVNLTARSRSEDVLDVPDLGYDTNVGPQLPGQLIVIAPRAGSYPIRLRYADRTVATLKVRDE